MRVLLVTYDFPPVGGMGVQRVVKLARYLPEFGVVPVVLSNAHALGNVIDPEVLVDNGLQDLELVRAGGERLARLYRARDRGSRAPVGMYPELLWSVLRYGDVYGLWYRSLRQRLAALVRELRVDLVWSTLPPASTGFIGRDIARLAGLPWVLDLRDSMVANVDHSRELTSRLQALVAPGIERRLAMAADRIVTVSQPMIDNMAARLGESVRGKSVVIANGFDPVDVPANMPPPRNPKLTFVYAGTFTGLRRPDVLVTAVNQAVATGRLDPATLRFDFYGRYSPEVAAAIEALHPQVERHQFGFVPQSQVFAAVLRADCALIITVPGTGGGVHEVLTGKVFDYLGLRKRVLVLTDSSSLRSLMDTTGLGNWVGADDVAALSAMLVKLSADWRRDGHLACQPDPAVIARYDRRVQAGQLAGIFRELVAR